MPDAAIARRVRQTRRRLVVATVVTIIAAANGIAFDPDQRRLVVQLALGSLGVIAVLAAVGALRHAAPLAPRSPLDRSLPRARAGAPTAPPDLARVARRLEAAQASAADARRHLGPIVATIAADRVRDRSHTAIELDSVYATLPQPTTPELALVLDPALDDVDTRALPGLDAGAAERLVRALEQL
jgi:hypothetical protein